MKNLKMFFLSFIVTALSISTIAANNIDVVNPNTQEELRSSIYQFLDDSDNLITEEARSATIKFLVNSDNEIVVLDVETEHNDIDRFVKSSLNYQKVDVDGVKAMNLYSVKVTFADSNANLTERSLEIVNPLYDLSMSTFAVVPVAEVDVICFHSTKLAHCESIAIK